MRQTIIIEVSGGGVQAVHCEQTTDIIVVDWDNVTAGLCDSVCVKAMLTPERYYACAALDKTNTFNKKLAHIKKELLSKVSKQELS